MESSQLDGIEEHLTKTLKELDQIERHTKKTMYASVAIASFFIYSAVIILFAAAIAFVVGLFSGNVLLAQGTGGAFWAIAQIFVITDAASKLNKD